MMFPTQQMEEFSIAYLHAVAACAGITYVRPLPDDDGIDIQFVSNSEFAPRLEAQVKSTKAPVPSKDTFSFVLKRSNYEQLRRTTATPRILIVVLLPEDTSEWLYHSENEMVVRRCGYWLSIQGYPSTQNETSITLQVPRANLFSPASLTDMMNRLNKRQPL